MKKFIIALILGFSAMLQAQNTLSGTVTDLKNQPLKGVSVYASELHKGTTTDENGKYTLSNLPNRNLKISFTFVGFATQNKTINSLQKENSLDVILEEAIFE
ncbi:MAG: carboxypeptidase-like regulatory domain-containing protein, partial [Flavobacterium sp.]|nr:carboxypeptidase-like regulatory domain-containing protein [Flavobacterium sp.]